MPVCEFKSLNLVLKNSKIFLKAIKINKIAKLDERFLIGSLSVLIGNFIEVSP